MAYESFTLDKVTEQFSLDIMQSRDAYGEIAKREPSDWLKTTIAMQAPLVVGKTSEKARSELLISPILVEVRRLLEEQIMVFSGVKFDVDKKAGLFGYCDFLISRNPLVDAIQAPVIAVVEAKKEDLNAGVPQCLAEMVAAQKYNRERNEPLPMVYGTVTDGTRWRFLQLEATTATLDLREYFLAELPQLLGILAHMAS